MKDYSSVTLGEIFDIARGGSPRPIQNFITDDPEGINWIMIGDASEGTKYITSTKKRIKKSGVSKSRMVYPGDFLLTNSMSFGHPYIMNTSGCIHDGWLVLSKKQNNVDQDYFYYLLGSDAVYSEFARRAAGTTVKNLNTELVKGVQIPLPPLEEQRRIAAILDQADAVRRKRKEAIRLTEDLLRAAFLDMFGDPVTNPKGWEVAELDSFGEVITGNTPPRSNTENFGNDIEWIKSDNITTPEHFLTKAVEGLSQQGMKLSRIVPPGSVLVACIAGSRSSIGRAAIADREVAFNQQINAVIPNLDVDTYFLYSHFFVAQHLVQAKSTDSMKGLVSKSKFASIQFIKPPKERQQEFGNWFLNFYRLYQNLLKDDKQSENLFNALLQRAFRGEL